MIERSIAPFVLDNARWFPIVSLKPEYARHLDSIGDELGIPGNGRSVVMRSDTSHTVKGTRFWSARDWLLR